MHQKPGYYQREIESKWTFSKGKCIDSVYNNEKENLRVLTDKEIYTIVKKTHYETVRLNYVGLSMQREWKKTEFPKEYYIWIWKQDWEVDQEIDGNMKWSRMEE